MRRSLVLAIVVLTSVAAACEREPSVPPGAAPATDTDRRDTDMAMAKTTACVNRVEGYVVQYPAGWHVNNGDILSPCAAFDPDPVEIPRASELPLEIAIVIDFEPVSFATLTGEVLGRRDLVRQVTMVDGREGVRIESETTGEGLHERGIRMYQYFVNLGDTTMVAATYDAGPLPFERKRRILDAMMTAFEFR